MRWFLLLLALLPVFGQEKFYTYVGELGSDYTVIAWGAARGSGNTIGRGAKSFGKAVVTVGAQKKEENEKSWVKIEGLEPDTQYAYTVTVNGRDIAKGVLQTWPEKTERFQFFVIGDYGNGSKGQRQVAAAMWREFQEQEKAGLPVRFVITTGDNIYADRFLFNSGDKDNDWRPKFFDPYEPLIARIPFYPTPGNHDGNETESRQDLPVYLDNFFFPGGKPARYYKFSVGGLAEFYGLDTSLGSLEGPTLPLYGADSPQFKWLKSSIEDSKAPWKIPYFHHPPFEAGPRHEPSLGAQSHLVQLFAQNGVKVVFNGHEHNLQFSGASPATSGIRFVISGAGGELRSGNILRDMARSHIEGWAPQLHFLRVEIAGGTMRIWPVSFVPVKVVNAKGQPIAMPLVVELGGSTHPSGTAGVTPGFGITAP